MTHKNLKTLLITSWVVLIICFILKLFGVEAFEFSVENTKFIQLCEFIDNYLWIKMILACLNCIITTTPMLCIMLNKKMLDKTEIYVFIPLMIIKSISSWYVGILSGVLDIIIMIVLPLLRGRFKNYKRVILVVILVLVFQVITLVTRNSDIGNYFNEQSALVSLLLQVDYIIMIFISYLYHRKLLLRKEV